MDFNDLRSKITSYQPAMLERLEQLVNHETPSTDKPALDVYARYMSTRFEQLGGETTILENPGAGDQLQVLFPAAQAKVDHPGLLLCHYDTVWELGTLKEQPFRVDGDRVYGPGIYDMKASHVMAEFALKAINELQAPLPRPFVILFTSDEETGSHASRGLIEEQARQVEFVLVLEPPTAEGYIKTARKGVGSFSLQVRGKAAHAGTQPERGLSAIHELARQITCLEELADNAAGTTVNVGVIAGGTRSNVIAAKAEAVVDVRAWTEEEVQRLETSIKGLQPLIAGVELEIQGGFNRPPMVRSQAIAELFQKAARVGKSLGMELKEGSTGGGSDGNFTAALSVPTLDGLGAMGDGAHADYEHIFLSQLPDRTTLLAALLLDL